MKIISLVGFVWMTASQLTAASITWTGGSDGRSWHIAQNWTPAQKPDSNDDVIIPMMPAGTTVEITSDSGNVTVKSLTCSSGLKIVSGTLNVKATSRIDGPLSMTKGSLTVTGSGSSLLATNTVTVSASNLAALAGGQLILHGLTEYSAKTLANWENATLRADGAGSLLDLSRVTSFTGDHADHSFLKVQATKGGKIDLSAVATLISGHVDFLAENAGSVLDLSSMTTFNGSLFLSSLIARNATVLLNDGLTAPVNLNITLEGTAVMKLEQLTMLSNGGLSVIGTSRTLSNLTQANNASLTASGGSLILPVLTTATKSSLAALAGGKLVLHALTEYSGQSLNLWESSSLRAEGVGSLLDLSRLNTLTGSHEGYSSVNIQATKGGKIDLSAVTTMVSGRVDFLAENAGSLLDLSSMTAFNGSLYFSSLIARNATVLLNDGLTAPVNLNITLEGTAVMKLEQLTALRNGGLSVIGTSRTLSSLAQADDTSLTASGGSLILPVLTTATKSSLAALAGGKLVLHALTEYSGQSLNLWESSSLRAEGVGSLLDLSRLNTLTGSHEGYSSVNIQATKGGKIDLSAVTTMVSGRVDFLAENAGSLLDLSSMTTFNGSLFLSSLIARNATVLLNDGLTAPVNLNITLEGTAVMKLEQLTMLSNGGLSVIGTSRTLSNLTQANNASLTASGGSLILPVLTTATKSSLAALAGGKLVLHALTEYSGQSLNLWQSSSLRAEGVGSLLDLSRLNTLTGSHEGYSSVNIQATKGGKIDLSAVTTMVSGRVDFLAENAGSVLDLSSMTTFNGSINNSSLTVKTSGQLLLGKLAQTSRATFNMEGVYIVPQNGAMRGSGTFPNGVNNAGVFEATLSGQTLQVQGNLMNTGSVGATGGGILAVAGTLTLNDTGFLKLASSSTVSITQSFLGNTTNIFVDPAGKLLFNGAGSQVSPQQLEVMSRDLGASAAGFKNNFVFGTLALAGNTRLRLIDEVRNTGNEAPECVYVGSLIVPAGSTLDLNGLKLYARVAQIVGTVINGSIIQMADSGPISLNAPLPGTISESGELDEWSFYGRAGTAVTVALETGGGQVVTPVLSRGQVSLMDSSGAVLATANSTAANQTLLLNNIALMADGQFKIRVRAASTHTANKGNYRVAVWEVTPENQALVLNQPRNGRIETPYSIDTWNFSANAGQSLRLDLINASSRGIAFRLVGPDGWVGFENITGVSDLVTLPTSGRYSLTAYGTGGAFDIAYTFKLTETQQTVLTVNTPFSGSFAGNGHAQIFSLDVSNAGPLELFLQNSGAGNRAEIYASRGIPPSRSSYEYAIASGPGANRSLLIPSASTGTWYILVYADKMPAPSSYTLLARMNGIALHGLSLTRQATNVQTDLILSGAGFLAGTLVELVSETDEVIAAANVTLDSYSQLSVTFAANAAAPGNYNIRVVQPGGASATLSGTFTILPAGQPKLETKLILPSAFGRHAVATIYVEYANTGNASMPAPLLVLKSSDPDGSDRPILTLDQNRIIQNFWSGTAGLPPGTSHEVYILASGMQPGVLNPGERFSVPVHFIGLLQPWNFSDNSVEMEIRNWTADDPTPINWAARKEALRPPTLDAAIWDVVYTNLTSGLTTNADYVRMLNDNARYLSRLGMRVTDVDDLWSFEVQQAYGHSALPVLHSATDAAVTAPGTPLSLTRQFSANLRSRNSSGLFGQGWFTPWQNRLQVERNGDLVKLIGEGGSARTYSKDTRKESYFSDAGDSSQLRVRSGAYELVQPNGTFTRFRSDGRIDHIQDANGNRVTATWNASGQLTALTHSSGASITVSYGSNGFVSQVIESTGRSQIYAYSGPYLTQVTTDDGKTTSYVYETAGTQAQRHALLSVTEGGASRRFVWDVRGRLESSSVADGEEMVLFGYDSAGTVSVTQAGGITSLHFEHRGLLARVVDPLGNITTSEFDKDLRLHRLVLSTGESQSFSWCNCGSPTSITDELGHVTRFSYDHPLKKMTSFTDAKNNVTRYTHDTQGNPLDTIYADQSVERVGDYTANGLPQLQTNRRGQSSRYTWTSSGKVARQTFADGSYNALDYDSRDNLVQVTEHPVSGPDKITTYTYSHATDGDRLKKVDYPGGKWVEYFYDAEGRRNRLTDSAGGDTRYEYDAAGRLWKLRDAAEVVLVEYLYDVTGQLHRINKGNGTYTTYQYDLAGQILHLINHAPNGTPNSRFDYTYDSRGRRVSMGTLDGAWTYGYDATGQLVRAVFASTNPEIESQDLRYAYDALGNRTATLLNGEATAYVANSLNQYSSVGGVTQQHDADGNLTFDGERTMDYDAQSRLIRVTGSHGVTEYEYDALGNRIASVTNGVRTDYLLDTTGLVNVLEERTTSAGSTRYSYGLGLTARNPGSASSSVLESSFFEFDLLGSVIGLSSPSGILQNAYHYKPFGDTLKATTTLNDHFQSFGQFGVTAEPSDQLFMRARFFATQTGRFLIQDPIGLLGQDTNLYRYVSNSPLNYIDPSGEIAIIPIIIRAAPYLWRAAKWGGARLWNGSKQFGKEVGTLFRNPKEFINNKTESAVKSAWWGTLSYNALKPEGDGKDGGDGSGGAANSNDPNEKIGPGFGAQGWVKGGALLPYRINFENLGPGSKDENGNPYATFATAPAQRVTITDPLATSFDWTTFQITDLGWGDTLIHVPANTSHYTTAVPITYQGKTFQVEIEAGIDFTTGRIFVRFQSMDPETGLPPDVLTGFLPPEDGTGIGMGHFSYTVRSRADLPNGTEIRNIALIKFDGNEVIATNQVDPQDPSQGTDPDREALVTLDATPPISAVHALPQQSNSTFPVSWSGSDAQSGIRQFQVLVSEAGSSFLPWITTSHTSAVFEGREGVTYAFICIAQDNAGNVEIKETAPEAFTTTARFPSGTLLVSTPYNLSLSGLNVVKVTGLPQGLEYDLKTGQVTGFPKRAGNYEVTIQIRGGDGKITQEQFELQVDDLPSYATGSFSALMDRHDILGSGLGGAVNFKVTSSGSASGQLLLAGKRHAFKGQLTALSVTEIYFEATVNRGSQAPPLAVRLNLGTDHLLTGTVKEGEASADLNGWRVIWHKKTRTEPALEVPTGQQGLVNVLTDLTGTPWRDSLAIPQGIGYASLTINKLGAVRLKGRHLDGSALTLSSSIGPDGRLRLWAPLYKNTGSVILSGVLDSTGFLLGNGDMLRQPQGQKEKLYREGFGGGPMGDLPAGPVPLDIVGGKWTPPAKNTPILQRPYNPQAPAANAWLIVRDGGIKSDTSTATPDLPVIISDKNKVTVEGDNPADVKIKLTPKTGLLTGSLLLQDISTDQRKKKRTVKFQGLCVPGLDGGILGGGYFILPQLEEPAKALSGKVLLMEGSPSPLP